MEDKSILAEIEYCDLFGNVEQQVVITKIFSNIFKIREDLLQILKQYFLMKLKFFTSFPGPRTHSNAVL